MKISIGLLLCGALLGAASCKQFSDSSHMEGMARMKDSIFKNYPSVAAVSMNVKDRTLLLVALGDRHLFKADDARRRKTAGELALMMDRLFGKDNGIDETRLIVTDNERNDVAEPPGGIATSVNMDSLRKTTTPAH